MKVSSQRQFVRGSTSVIDKELELIRRRIERTSTNAIQALEGLKRFLAQEVQPQTRKHFERFGIRLQVASEAMLEAAGEMK